MSSRVERHAERARRRARSSASTRSTRRRQSASVAASPPWSSTTRWRARSANAGSRVELRARRLVERVRGRRPSARRGRLAASSRCSMSMPNGVPQSPTWFWRITRWPSDLEHARERVADDRAAQVPDVHLLGDVRRRVVDDDRLRRGGRRDAEARVGRGIARRRARGSVGVEREVDEARRRRSRPSRTTSPSVERARRSPRATSRGGCPSRFASAIATFAW